MDPISQSESILERLIFRNRPAMLILFFLISLVLGYQAMGLKPDASFEKMIPGSHPYIQNFMSHREDLAGLGNSIRIAVEARDGDIFTAEYQELLKQVTDEVFFIPGVDRSALKSLWTPNVRWKEVTEEGFVGGAVIPNDYDGSDNSLEQLRQNTLRSGQVGRLVANDFKSSIIHAPLFDINPETGARLDYQAFSAQLEEVIRDKYQTDQFQIHITGFAKVVGDLIEGASEVVMFFLLALIITAILLYLYTRCLRSALVALSCSMLAVIWQLGLLHSLGYGLDPYSMLVPFLVFAIAVSHGVQIINGITMESAQGAEPLAAARRSFRSLYIPGLTALFSDGIGFITLMVIDIAVIQELAVAAAIGVAVVVLTNLLLLPVLMSYLSISPKALSHVAAQATANSLAQQQVEGRIAKRSLWTLFQGFTRPRTAMVTVVVAGLLFAFGVNISRDLKIGDLDPGTPELRPDSRYNLDNAFMTSNYSTSSDIFVVMVETEAEQCASFENLDLIDRFQWEMANVKGVQSALSLADVAKSTLSGLSEGSLKWHALSRNQYLLNAALAYVPQGMVNAQCSLTPVLIFLNDHKADTLERVISAAELFAKNHNTDSIQFQLAAGNSGIEAATNRVIGTAQYQMLAWVYGVVGLLCLITFRSWRTLVCIIVPLALTSVLCQALMTFLGIGVKVATLPVIALGVGIGVDYGIYIYSRLESYLSQGMALSEAYLLTLMTTGRAVAFTGLTLAIGVGTWLLSPIKFQADMGVLLTFMFLWNMLGALVLLPALAYFLIKPKVISSVMMEGGEGSSSGMHTPALGIAPVQSIDRAQAVDFSEKKEQLFPATEFPEVSKASQHDEVKANDFNDDSNVSKDQNNSGDIKDAIQ
ncbi:RND family transporter [Motiliproteus sp. MSK22-1]|uniref:efflux RND transporter permease subunit n=1 Tax=Motiliproteus sp. MSK22-1 TaxID=1897630 RepID=UPI0009F9C457|nr:MMPL family transporter [Motiliproteus sp. MSK22-1]